MPAEPRRWRAALIAIAAILLVRDLRVSAGEVLPEYQLKAEFIERFTRFVEWPPSHTARFVIGVIGDDPFNGYLRQIAATRKVDGKDIELRRVANAEGAAACDVLFIARSERPRLAQILAETRNRPVLTIGDSDGFAEAGVIINFYMAEDKVRFEVNTTAVDASGLRFSSKLLKLAKVVEGKR